MFAVIQASAQQPGSQRQATQQSKTAGTAKQTGEGPACKDLKSIAAAVDRRFDEENDAILVMIRGSDKPGPTVTSDQPDTIWDTLVDCSRETKSSSQRAEALRVLTTWEKIRADNLQKLYSAAQPVGSPQCRDLDRINDIVIVAHRQKDGEQPETGGILVRKELPFRASGSFVILFCLFRIHTYSRTKRIR